jgi:NAD(P)-dependent dehydrogenase (short-subunit alcohol dehydrogenase family)
VTEDFTGTVALVIGGSRGIGAGTARLWARRGAAVVLAARDAGALGAVADEIIAAGGRALALPTDTTDADAVRTPPATNHRRCIERANP